MKSIESMEPGEAWTSSAPVAEEKVVVPGPAAPMDTDDMNEKSLLNILAKEGLGGLEGEDERKQFNKLLIDNVRLRTFSSLPMLSVKG